ncbi:hypothetical protein F8M41_002619 [Gigaspora margarita]|uniref:Uncharacterized protein n=1 Tax=Gigaspora margarita TaxID=4874 RepID=A0A8H4A8D3_GIGMA|nr:hypothetical protein F8M41_002619 [Gigaspora margarita]
MKSNNIETSNPDPQAYHFLYLDIEVPWPVSFPDNKEHREVWQNVKFIRDNTVISVKKTKKGFKIIDKYEPIHKSKKAGSKYVRGGPNIILTKKTKPGFWLGIDEKFLVREVSVQSDIERLDSNAVVYGLYQI